MLLHWPTPALGILSCYREGNGRIANLSGLLNPLPGTLKNSEEVNTLAAYLPTWWVLKELARMSSLPAEQLGPLATGFQLPTL